MSIRNWIGYAVSVSCGEPLNCYQGFITDIDLNTVTLDKVFMNGYPYSNGQVTLNVTDVKDLKIIQTAESPEEQTYSTVTIDKTKKKQQKMTVCESLEDKPYEGNGDDDEKLAFSMQNQLHVAANNGNQSYDPLYLYSVNRSNPIEIQSKSYHNSKFNQPGSGSAGTSGATPRGPKFHGRANSRNDACFGVYAVDPVMLPDFDFEKNLALFDKQGLWEKMRSSNKPDLLRQTDKSGGKYRHDENVLGSAPAATRAIYVPDDLRGMSDYVTDEGVIVPTVKTSVRRTLWNEIYKTGFFDSAILLLARAATDVILKLVGGGHRLDPRNTHQVPVVSVIVGNHRMGAAGAIVARLLLSHGARAELTVVEDGQPRCGELLREAAAFAVSGGVAGAPPNCDLQLLALHDPLAASCPEVQAPVAARPAVLLEPSATALELQGAVARATVCALLPTVLPPSTGRLMLVDVAPPPHLFADLGMQYRPPFGALSVLPLHEADQ